MNLLDYCVTPNSFLTCCLTFDVVDDFDVDVHDHGGGGDYGGDDDVVDGDVDDPYFDRDWMDGSHQ